VTIFAPWLGKKEAAPLRLWAIRIWEADPPPDVEEPVEWMLITSLSIETLAEAAEAIGLYGFRWLIEEYHKCLKSGCAIEKKQLEEADRLEALLGIAAVVAVSFSFSSTSSYFEVLELVRGGGPPLMNWNISPPSSSFGFLLLMCFSVGECSTQEIAQREAYSPASLMAGFSRRSLRRPYITAL